jgi:TRAP-type transport system periplasmic protein
MTTHTLFKAIARASTLTVSVALAGLCSSAFAQTSASPASTAPATSPKAEITLYFQHYWPQTALTVRSLVTPWCDKVSLESQGRMKCLTLPAMSGGGTPAQLVDRVKEGVDDLVLTVLGYTPGRFPRMEVFELPFMTRNAEAASKAAWEFMNKNAAQEFTGIKVLGMWVHDEGQIHTKDKAIRTLEDFKGMKMRAPSRETAKLLQALGATPVGMPITGVTEAITKGTIDGTMVPWDAATSFRIHEAANIHTETPEGSPALYTVGLMFAMNEKKYNSLSPELRAVIDRNSGAELSARMGKMWDDSAAPARAKAKAAGNQFYTLPAPEMARWVEAAKPVQADWMIDMHKRGIDGRALFDDAKALLAKYEAPAAAANTEKFSAQSAAALKAQRVASPSEIKAPTKKAP